MTHGDLHITKYHKVIYLAACHCGWHGTETVNEETARVQLAVHKRYADSETESELAEKP